MKWILPTILATITRHNRQQVDLDWSSTSLVFNLFRVWELLFWRREGIRPDGSSRNGVVYSYSWEHYLVTVELTLKGFITRKIPRFHIVYLPQLQLAGMGLGGFTPFRFAIAFDNATRQGGLGPTTSQTYAYTCTGSNRFLMALDETQDTTTITAATYNAVSMTALDTYSLAAGYSHGFSWYLAAPASGSNNRVVTISPSDFNNQIPISYTGVIQTSPIDTHGSVGPNAAATSLTFTTTIGTANCWLLGMFRDLTGGSWTGTGGTTFRIDATALDWADSNTDLATGSRSISATTAVGVVGGLYASFIPAGGGAATARPIPFFALLGLGT